MQQRSQGIFPPQLNDQCTQQGIPISGNAAGHASATDLSGLPAGPFPQVLGWTPRAIGAMTGCVLLLLLRFGGKRADGVVFF